MNSLRVNLVRFTAVVLVVAVLLTGYTLIGGRALAASASTVSAGVVHPGHPAKEHNPFPPRVMKQLAFHDAMRKLWEDHVTWTRLFIVSAAGGLPDTNQAAARLLQNQSDIGNAVKPFYGDAAGDKLTALLKDHILIAADLVTAAKAGDAAKVEAAKTRWYANADEIAAFLNSANPDNWPLDEMKAMMREHLDMTLQEATARLTGDWAADIAAYDKIHVQALGMADMLSNGIMRQFPKQFK